MKQLILLMALSLISVTVSAQEVTKTKNDKSYLEGREFLQKMNAKTQGRYEAPTEKSSTGFSKKEMEEMMNFMKNLNARTQPEKQVEDHDADSGHKPHAWDRAFTARARADLRRLGANTNPTKPTGKPARNPGAKKTHGTR